LEKIGNRQIKDFPPTTLFYDDLAEIVEIINSTCKKIEITTKDYEITDPKELEVLAKKYSSGRFDNIKIQGYNPYINVELRTYGIQAYISEDTTEQHGIIAKVRNIVTKGKKINPEWLTKVFYLIITLVIAFLFLMKQFKLGLGFSLLFFASTPITLPFFVEYQMRNKVIIHTDPRGSEKGFYERNKDNLIVAVIAGVAVSVITYLISNLTHI